MKLAIAYASAIILVAIVFGHHWPRCDAHSPHGPRIGGDILIGGCP